jgi:subtilisin-like proprotein convertase family protein
MKNASFTSKTLRLMTFALAMLLWQFAGAQTYNGSGLPLPIPLTGTGGFPCLGGPTASSANVPLTGTVNGDFFIDNVTISLTHTWNSDLAITLVSPSGTTLNLSDGNGGTSDNYINTVFKDDDATDYPNITTGTGPFTGTFNPEGPGTFSSTFGGEPINGNWTLEICDGVGGDSGQLTAFSITFASLSCEITCPDNVVAANSPGVCEGCVDIPLPDVDDACAGSPAGFVTLNSPTVQYNFDALGLIATPADVSGATADALFPVNINVTYDGDHGATTESFVLTGPDGSQVINTSGGECVTQNPSASVAAATWNNWVNTFGSTLTFTLQPDADVDNFCAVQQYSIEVVYATAEESAANDYNGLADASDCYPVGTTTVTYTTFDVTGAPVQCSFTVTINDEEAPVFPNCPNDILVDLLPGLCETSIVFDAEAVDNCPASSNTFDVGGQTIGGLGINCNLGLNTLPTKHYRTWTVPAGPPVSITGINTGINTSPGIVGAEYDVNVYRVTGGFPGGTLTLVASGASGVVPAGANFLHTTAVTPTQPVSAGDELVIEIDHPGGVFNFFFGYGPNNQPSWLEAVDCGAAVPTLSPSLGVPDGLVMQVSAATAGVDVARCDDIPFNSGDLWPIGSYDICFEATDEAGNPGNCNFNVTITEFSNATETLACNDNVQVSIPAAGVAEVGADMILEGGPYGCYDDYIVSIEGGDNLVGCSDIGGPWTVMVTDPDTGNKCWGSIVVEDKLDPTIECEDFAIACSQDIDDIVFDVPFGGTIVQASGARPTYDASTDNVEFTIGVPGAAQVTDINVSLNISHTWTSDLDVFLIAPNGDQITLFNDQCGTADDVDVTMDDDGAPFACSGGTPAIAGTLQPTQPLSTFNGLNPSGTWTVRVTDDAGGDATNINNITLEITYSSVYPSPVADDNCPLPFNALSFVDTEFTSDPCDGDAGQILRTWTVTDASGNTASCVQTISIDRPGLDGIMVPPFYDDIQAPAFDCDNDPFWDVNGNGYPDATVDEAGAPTINGLPIVNGDLCNFTVSFEDEVVDICPGSFKIFRSWLVIDWCAGESVEYDQIIKVVDNEGPEVVCPQGPVTINVYSGAYQQNGPHDICTGNVVIPAIEVVGDNCSGYDGSEDVTEIWTLGAGQLLGSIAGNGGTFQNIELIADNPPTNNARYTIRHRVYDGCGNLTDCLYDITVVDKIPPVAICDEITELGLSPTTVVAVTAVLYTAS